MPMGKFLEGFERARAAAEAREAEAQRRTEHAAAALQQLSDTLGKDSEALDGQKITMQIEHGSLVLRRVLLPVASVTFDPDSERYKIHEYSVTGGKTQMEGRDIDDCATKLGEYAFSLTEKIG